MRLLLGKPKNTNWQAVSASEILVNYEETTRRNITEGCRLQDIRH
jgi:hypothetical protein